MSVPMYQARRANVDDLAALRQLWEGAHLPAAELEKHLTDFQVAEDQTGALAGCIALHIEARQGWIRSQAFRPGDPVDQLRPQLWNRLHNLARNHQLLRLWTQEADSFWESQGFRKPDEASIQKRPAGFGTSSAEWRLLTLREETEQLLSVEKEFDLFVQSARDASAEALRQALFLKYLAWSIVAVAVLVLGYFALRIFARLPPISGPK